MGVGEWRVAVGIADGFSVELGVIVGERGVTGVGLTEIMMGV